MAKVEVIDSHRSQLPTAMMDGCCFVVSLAANSVTF
jgi:hypothetical protein